MSFSNWQQPYSQIHHHLANKQLTDGVCIPKAKTLQLSPLSQKHLFFLPQFAESLHLLVIHSPLLSHPSKFQPSSDITIYLPSVLHPFLLQLLPCIVAVSPFAFSPDLLACTSELGSLHCCGILSATLYFSSCSFCAFGCLQEPPLEATPLGFLSIF